MRLKFQLGASTPLSAYPEATGWIRAAAVGVSGDDGVVGGALPRGQFVNPIDNWTRHPTLTGHRGIEPRLSFFRDKAGTEVDLLVEAGAKVLAIEMKSGQTVAADFFDALETFQAMLTAPPISPFLVYGGSASQARSRVQVLGWNAVHQVDWSTGKPRAGARKKPRVRRKKAS